MSICLIVIKRYRWVLPEVCVLIIIIIIIIVIACWRVAVSTSVRQAWWFWARHQAMCKAASWQWSDASRIPLCGPECVADALLPFSGMAEDFQSLRVWHGNGQFNIWSSNVVEQAGTTFLNQFRDRITACLITHSLVVHVMCTMCGTRCWHHINQSKRILYSAISRKRIRCTFWSRLGSVYVRCTQCQTVRFSEHAENYWKSERHSWPTVVRQWVPDRWGINTEGFRW